MSDDELPDWVLEPPRLTVLSDAAIEPRDRDADQFDLRLRVGPLYDILRNPDTETPLTIAIYGDWGAGKSSAMRWLDGRLDEWNREGPETWEVQGDEKEKKRIKTVWFHPWKYHDKEDVWRGLIAEVIIACLESATDPGAFLADLKDFGVFFGKSVESLISGTKFSASIPEVVKAEFTAKDSVKEIGQHAEDYLRPQNAYLNEFESALNSWVDKTLGDNQRLVIFIDDLDRCMPDISLQVLEALKLYLDIEKLIFIVGVDREVVDALVREHYRKLGLGKKADDSDPIELARETFTEQKEKSGHYLDKMFQVEVKVAPSDQQIEEFLDGLLESLETNRAWRELSEGKKDENGETVEKGEKDVFRAVVHRLGERSPREMKRLINSALIAGAGARMSALADDPDKEPPTAAQGMQVFFVRRILEDKFTRGALVSQNRGTRFFTAWSEIVQKDADIPRTVRVPPEYTRLLEERVEHGTRGQEDGQSLDEALSSLPKQFHELLKERTFVDLFGLLQDEDLGELMQLPYPGEAVRLGGGLGSDSDAQIVKEAIARSRNTSLNELRRADYEQVDKLDLKGSDLRDLAQLPELRSLRRLDLTDTLVSDLGPLKRFPGIEWLSLSRTHVSDLAPLKALKRLNFLALSSDRVADITSLKDLPALKWLVLGGTQIVDLEPLAKLMDLRGLGLTGSHQVVDFLPLAGLKNLQTLQLGYTEIVNVAPLAGLTKLKTLKLGNSQVADLVPLAGLTNLQALDLRNTQVADLAPLAGLTNLQRLELDDTQVADLAPLAGLTNLQRLDLDNTQVADLAPLAGLTNLEMLHLNNTEVADLAPLAGLTNLQWLGLDGTQISEKNIADLQAALPELQINR